MKPTAPKLIRWAGLSAMAAGIIFVVIQPIHPPDVLSSVTTDAWAIVQSSKVAMCILGLIGLTGLYARQANEAGWLGLAGYLLFSLFYALTLSLSSPRPSSCRTWRPRRRSSCRAGWGS